MRGIVPEQPHWLVRGGLDFYKTAEQEVTERAVVRATAQLLNAAM